LQLYLITGELVVLFALTVDGAVARELRALRSLPLACAAMLVAIATWPLPLYLAFFTPEE
jgi:hypothetical protein